MECIIDELTDAMIDIFIKYTDVSREIKDFVSNANFVIKRINKIEDLVTKGHCIKEDKRYSYRSI